MRYSVADMSIEDRHIFLQTYSSIIDEVLLSLGKHCLDNRAVVHKTKTSLEVQYTNGEGLQRCKLILKSVEEVKITTGFDVEGFRYVGYLPLPDRANDTATSLVLCT